jgi:hypothetical protein
MFDKIGQYAEAVATSAGQTRRGFLGLMGKAALSLASVVGGLLLVSDKAAAFDCTGGCRYLCPDGSRIGRGCNANCRCDATTRFRGMTCNLEAGYCHNA